ncbi:MAG: Maf family protein [Brotaphodocola sp.]
MEDNKKIRIILASASPRRRELLGQVGITPEVIPSHVEETVTSTHPELVVMELSAQKAGDVAAICLKPKQKNTEDHWVVIGSDTVVSVDGMILGKPKDEEDAIRMISIIQGRTHQVYTGVTMIFGTTGERVTFAEKTDVQVYPMTDAQIRQYTKTSEPYDKAGAYGIQGYFAAHIRGVSGDYNNVVGLPVGRVCQELFARGFLLYGKENRKTQK